MLTSKQRAYLRSLATDMDTIMQVGKEGVTETLIKTVSDALEARELIKMRALESSGESARSVAEALGAATDSEVCAVVGSKFVLYRQSKKHKKIILP